MKDKQFRTAHPARRDKGETERYAEFSHRFSSPTYAALGAPPVGPSSDWIVA